VLASGRVELGPGRYETLLHLGDLGGHPLLTFTAPWRVTDVAWRPPSASYLRVLKAGLREAYGWTDHRIGGYLADLPGCARLLDRGGHRHACSTTVSTRCPPVAVRRCTAHQALGAQSVRGPRW
jgi:hypothetical protein